VEHIGRGTAKEVDALIIVADSNLKSLEIAKHIKDMAQTAGLQQLFLVGNRVMNETQKEAIKSFADKNGLSLLALIPFDTKITDSDMLGQTPLKNKGFPSVKAIDDVCELLLKNRLPMSPYEHPALSHKINPKSL
jgi:CO dehydrogenase maturation factor